jgi:hypothetical protein
MQALGNSNGKPPPPAVRLEEVRPFRSAREVFDGLVDRHAQIAASRPMRYER